MHTYSSSNSSDVVVRSSASVRLRSDAVDSDAILCIFYMKKSMDELEMGNNMICIWNLMHRCTEIATNKLILP